MIDISTSGNLSAQGRPISTETFTQMVLAKVTFNHAFPRSANENGRLRDQIQSAGFTLAQRDLSAAVSAFSALSQQSEPESHEAKLFADQRDMYSAFNGSPHSMELKQSWIFPAIRFFQYGLLNAPQGSPEAKEALEKLNKSYLTAAEIWPDAILSMATRFCERAQATGCHESIRTGAGWVVTSALRHKEKILLGDALEHRFGLKDMANHLLDAQQALPASLAQEKESVLQTWLEMVQCMQGRDPRTAKDYVSGIAKRKHEGMQADDALRATLETAQAMVIPSRKTLAHKMRSAIRFLVVGF